MSKRSDTSTAESGAADEGHARDAELRFVEEFGVLGESMGMPRMVARLWAWLMICDPPAQSSAEIARAIGVSRASVSTATRLLLSTGVIRRSAVRAARGHYFEVDPEAFVRLPAEERFGALRRQFQRGLDVLDDPEGQRGARLRAGRDFYAYVEAAVPELIAAYRARRTHQEDER